jgi:hypothetical protein
VCSLGDSHHASFSNPVVGVEDRNICATLPSSPRRKTSLVSPYSARNRSFAVAIQRDGSRPPITSWPSSAAEIEKALVTTAKRSIVVRLRRIAAHSPT